MVVHHLHTVFSESSTPSITTKDNLVVIYAGVNILSPVYRNSMVKVLFILKRREDYNAVLHSALGLSTGLFNSASFVNDMLVDAGIDSVLEVAIDNNCIDRLVTKHRPTHVIIEALWVVPSKFAVLQKLHPKVKWIVRLHSEMPFLAGEGNAMDWVGDYSAFKNVCIGVNAPRMMKEVKTFLEVKHQGKLANDKVIYMPNYYPHEFESKKLDKNKDTVDIACFGAVRPLKNHMLQAIGAIDFARSIGKKLNFHVNAGRIEMNGGPVLNNLKGLFEQISGSGHQLINHQWRPREEFLKLCATMDIGLQVSFSETFNIVGADLISQGVPLVGSIEIPWAVPVWCADPTSSDDIRNKLLTTWAWPSMNVMSNQFSLRRYCAKTQKIWAKYFLMENKNE